MESGTTQLQDLFHLLLKPQVPTTLQLARWEAMILRIRIRSAIFKKKKKKEEEYWAGAPFIINEEDNRILVYPAILISKIPYSWILLYTR